MGIRMTVLAFVLLSACIAGCPSSENRDRPATGDEGCKSFGQTCEVSPGKLGTCVYREQCKEGAKCFTCQSQH